MSLVLGVATVGFGTASGFLGSQLGEKLGFSREGCMLLGMVASIGGGYGAEKIHVNYDDIVSTVRYTKKTSK